MEIIDSLENIHFNILNNLPLIILLGTLMCGGICLIGGIRFLYLLRDEHYNPIVNNAVAGIYIAMMIIFSIFIILIFIAILYLCIMG